MYSRYFLLLSFIFYSNNMDCIQNPFKRKTSPVDQPASSFGPAEEMLKQIKDDLQAIRIVVADALEKNTYKEGDIKLALERLKANSDRINILEKITQDKKEELKMQAQIILLMYKALLEEAGVLDLWIDGYANYEKDLNDNFKTLPNNYLSKPDNKKLYQELGYKDEKEGQRASFNDVRQKYKEKFEFTKKNTGEKFSQYYFKPYLRVLDYVFRTPYSKVQYDSYLAGMGKYNEKANSLKKYNDSIHKLFRSDLMSLAQLKGEIESAFGL